jgi:hypothetical protein
MAFVEEGVFEWCALNDNGVDVLSNLGQVGGHPYTPHDALIGHDTGGLITDVIGLFVAIHAREMGEPDFPVTIFSKNGGTVTESPLVIVRANIDARSQKGALDPTMMVLGSSPEIAHHHEYTRARSMLIKGVNKVLDASGSPVKVPAIPPLRRVLNAF